MREKLDILINLTAEATAYGLTGDYETEYQRLREEMSGEVSRKWREANEIISGLPARIRSGE